MTNLKNLLTSLIVNLIFTGLLCAEEKMPNSSYQVATLAGGCFWCMQADFQKLDGIYEVISGYAGGKEQNPSYKQVASGKTSHVEAIQIKFDPQQISFTKLLDYYWQNVDPFDARGQFCDKGAQYISVIFYHDSEQKSLSEQSKLNLQKQVPEHVIVTKVLPFTSFYAAEDYHQNYHKKNPIRYKFYRYNCGRDSRLKRIWGN